MASQTQLNEFIKGISTFASKFHKKCSDSKPDNVIVSPLSVVSALALLSQGANGETFDELRRGLHLSDDKMANAENFLAFYELLEKSIGKSTLTIANRVYVSDGFTINQKFREVAVQKFLSDIQEVDFGQSEASASTINKFVEEKTNKKIKNLISPNMLNSLTCMVLVNAIYFKGNWKHKFNKRNTRKGNFYINEEDRCSVDFMAKKQGFKYGMLTDLDAAALGMEYVDSNLSFVILLPNKRNGLLTLDSLLCNYDLANITKNMREQKVDVKIPKFKVEFDLNLNGVLKEMGMTSMFSTADLDGLSGSPPPSGLYVSHVVHKAFIEVNEEGSEAAAATAVIIRERCLPAGPPPTPKFHADHPFIYLIVDTKNNYPIFTGSFKGSEGSNAKPAAKKFSFWKS